MKTDFFQSCGHCRAFQICWHIECSTFTSRVFQSSPEKLWVEPEVGGAGFPGSPQVGEARGCTSYSKRSPRVCCTDPEPEAQGGGILSWDTEHNQAEPELARAPPTTARTQMSPVPLRRLSGLQEIRVSAREESAVLCFPSRRGLTPRGSLECNTEILFFP